MLLKLIGLIGRPRLVTRVAEARDIAAAQIGDGSPSARFNAEMSRLQELLGCGQLKDALAAAQALVKRARTAGDEAYEGADYNLAIALVLVGRTLQMNRRADQALPLLDQARRRFEAISKARSYNKSAARAAARCLNELGACLLDLGRLDDSAAAYEEG